MALDVIWDDPEHRIIRYVFVGDWNWPQVYDAITTSDRWLDETDYKVHFIIDLRESSDSIAEKSLGNVRRLLTTAHKNTGTIVIVGTAQSVVMELAKSIVSMALRIMGRKLPFHYVDSIEEGRAILREEMEST